MKQYTIPYRVQAILFARKSAGRSRPADFFATLCSVLPSKSVYRVKGGGQVTDPNRLELLVKTHENTLYRTALAILGDVQEAEDAVQDAFLKYLEKTPAFESADHERAWLIRVTVNGCKSRLRAPWRRRSAPLLESYPAAAPEEQEALEAVLSLPPKERAAVHLYYYEGYKTPEIAAMTGEAEGTVRSRLTRARARLRELLKGEEP